VTINPETRPTYRLTSRQLLRSQMTFRRLSVRTLALAAGGISHKSTIGNLRSGARNTVGPELARDIEDVLFPGCVHGVLFEPTVSNRNVATEYVPSKGRRAA
jgi:hypothetical protein